MTLTTSRLIRTSAALLAIGLGAAMAVSIGGSRWGMVAAQQPLPELRLVPEDAAFVGFADIRAMLTSRLWQQLRQSMPVSPESQGKFEAETGISVERDIDRVLMYVAPPADGGQAEAGLVLARGRFDATRIEGVVRSHGASVETYQGQRLFITENPAKPEPGDDPKEAIAFSFIEPGLAAIGTKTLVQRAIDRRAGGTNVTGNEEVMNQVRGLQGGDIWAVGRYEALGGNARLPAAVAGQIPPISSFALSVRISNGLGGVLQVEARDEQSASELRDVVRGFISLGQMQASAEPGVQSLIKSLELSGAGRTVALSFEAPADLLDLLATRP